MTWTQEKRLAAPGRAVVLVVDDNNFFRKMEALLLEKAGFKVLTAADGREAFAIFEAAGGEIDAIVTDLVMPGLNGLELASLIHQLDSEIPIVLVSGSEGEECLTYPHRFNLQGAFQKPVNPADLVAKLRLLIEERAENEQGSALLFAES